MPEYASLRKKNVVMGLWLELKMNLLTESECCLLISTDFD